MFDKHPHTSTASENARYPPPHSFQPHIPSYQRPHARQTLPPPLQFNQNPYPFSTHQLPTRTQDTQSSAPTSMHPYSLQSHQYQFAAHPYSGQFQQGGTPPSGGAPPPISHAVFANSGRITQPEQYGREESLGQGNQQMGVGAGYQQMQMGRIGAEHVPWHLNAQLATNGGSLSMFARPNGREAIDANWTGGRSSSVSGYRAAGLQHKRGPPSPSPSRSRSPPPSQPRYDASPSRTSTSAKQSRKPQPPALPAKSAQTRRNQHHRKKSKKRNSHPDLPRHNAPPPDLPENHVLPFEQVNAAPAPPRPNTDTSAFTAGVSISVPPRQNAYKGLKNKKLRQFISGPARKNGSDFEESGDDS